MPGGAARRRPPLHGTVCPNVPWHSELGGDEVAVLLSLKLDGLCPCGPAASGVGRVVVWISCGSRTLVTQPASSDCLFWPRH